MTQSARIQQRQEMSERAAAEPGLTAGGYLPEGRRRPEGVKRSLSTTHRATRRRLVRGISEVSLYTVRCIERAGCSCYL